MFLSYLEALNAKTCLNEKAEAKETSAAVSSLCFDSRRTGLKKPFQLEHTEENQVII